MKVGGEEAGCLSGRNYFCLVFNPKIVVVSPVPNFGLETSYSSMGVVSL